MSWLLVGVGGSLGALCRYLLGKWMGSRYPSVFPVGTFVINVTGALLLGLATRFAGLIVPHAATSVSLFIGTGFCGAYTTYSTFSYETITLLRQRGLTLAGMYVTATLLVGFAAAGIGLYGVPGHFA